MMIKFLARGTGSAAAAADYLTREQNLSPGAQLHRRPTGRCRHRRRGTPGSCLAAGPFEGRSRRSRREQRSIVR